MGAWHLATKYGRGLCCGVGLARRWHIFFAAMVWVLGSVASIHAAPDKDLYEEVYDDFLAGFDGAPVEEEDDGEAYRSYKRKYKIKMPMYNDRAIMTTIVYSIYGKAPVVQDLLANHRFIWDAKTLRDLHITRGSQDHVGHTVIHCLDTADMPHSEGMGFLVKAAMPIHFLTATSNLKVLRKRQKIIRILMEKPKLRRALLKKLNRFMMKHEKSFVALYNRRHTLRTLSQKRRFNYQYAYNKSLSENSLYYLELLKRWAVDFTFVALLAGSAMAMESLLQRSPYLLGDDWRTWLTNHLPAFLKQLIPAAASPAVNTMGRLTTHYEVIRNVFTIVTLPFMLLRLYHMHKETLSAYAEAFYHQQAWYAMVQEVYALIQEDPALAKLCQRGLRDTANLVEGYHDDAYLSEYLALLEEQDLSNFSIFFSWVGKLLKTVGLFERCCESSELLGTMYEISTLGVLIHLAHYMACAKTYKNGLCFTKFVTSQTHPYAFFDIEGLWNLGIDPNKAVANNLYMDGSQAHMFFLLGANKGGKTSFAKAIALLAQTYGISPAKRATQSVFHMILTYFNIGDGDFIKDISQYTGELDRLGYLLRKLAEAGPDKSVLCLVDEPATGTGEGFAKILTRELAQHCLDTYPRSAFFFVTHYKDLRSMEQSNPRIQNYTVVVEHLDDKTFRYTYKIVRGTPSDEDDLIALKLLNERDAFPQSLKDKIAKRVQQEAKT